MLMWCERRDVTVFCIVKRRFSKLASPLILFSLALLPPQPPVRLSRISFENAYLYPFSQLKPIYYDCISKFMNKFIANAFIHSVQHYILVAVAHGHAQFDFMSVQIR